MRRRLVLCALLVMAAGLVSCTFRSASPNLEGPAGSVLMVGAAIDALSMDPAVAYEPSSVNLCLNAYEPLIRYDGNDFEHAKPDLAESWTVSPNAQDYTFHLRPGERFSSGRPVDAEAVRWSLQRAMDMDQGPAWILKANLEPNGRIEVVNPTTLHIHLNSPCVYFISTLFNPVACPVDRAEVEAHGNAWLREHSAGSGPYVLTSWKPDVGMTFERNPYYGGPPPPLSRVLVKDIHDAAMQAMMIQVGDLDMAYDLTPLQTDGLAKSPEVRIVPAPLLRVWYVGMNVKMKPLDDVRVRQAIRYAIDYDAIEKYLVRGHGTHIEGPVVSGMSGYQPHLGIYRHDADKARQLLREAGYPDGFDVTLSAGQGSTELGPTEEDLCAALQQDLQKVGIRCEVKTLATATCQQLYREAKLQLNLNEWGADYPDADGMVKPFGHSGGALARRVNYSGTPQLDQLIDDAAATVDPTRRAALYVQAQKLLMQDGPWAILVQSEKALPVRREVHGFIWNAQSDMEFFTCSKGPQ
ncbi:MAG: ABC transporter substrate-binding protein [Candidatus Xenobia bacterium]